MTITALISLRKNQPNTNGLEDQISMIMWMISRERCILNVWSSVYITILALKLQKKDCLSRNVEMSWVTKSKMLVFMSWLLIIQNFNTCFNSRSLTFRHKSFPCQKWLLSRTASNRLNSKTMEDYLP